MKIRSRSLAVAVGAAATIGLVASPALATTTTTYISNWTNNHVSANWSDNATSKGTTITLKNCTYSQPSQGTFSNAVLTLWRQRGALPDETKGDKAFYCYYSDSKAWSSPEADVYRFELQRWYVQGGTEGTSLLSSNPVTIAY